jgi:hypothetical protein
MLLVFQNLKIFVGVGRLSEKLLRKSNKSTPHLSKNVNDIFIQSTDISRIRTSRFFDEPVWRTERIYKLEQGTDCKSKSNSSADFPFVQRQVK